MNPFNGSSECPKCGASYAKCEYKNICNSLGTQQFLNWTCIRCGYFWQTNTKDETEPEEKE